MSDMHKFFTHMAVCHTAMAEKTTTQQQDIIKYSASSPDELALVQGAQQFAFHFLERTQTSIVIQINRSITQMYDIIAEFPFDSTRKRMSLLLK